MQLRIALARLGCAQKENHALRVEAEKANARVTFDESLPAQMDAQAPKSEACAAVGCPKDFAARCSSDAPSRTLSLCLRWPAALYDQSTVVAA